jgi:hypothetical protein
MKCNSICTRGESTRCISCDELLAIHNQNNIAIDHILVRPDQFSDTL